MDTVTRVQLLDEAVCILHSANTLRKGMNPTILLSTIGKKKCRKLSVNSRAGNTHRIH